MRVSVIICTRNRAEQLRTMLGSVAALHVPAGLHWQLIVVDNGSEDETRAVIEGFADRIPIEYGFEATPGLSNARNRGVALAKGDYICWTDDDVLLHPEWLTGYAEAFAAHPDAAFFGGPIALDLDSCTPPAWFADNRSRLAGILAERQLGDEPIALGPSRHSFPYGANYAVRAAEQRRTLYDPRLGVSPSHRRIGEETAVLGQIVLEGGHGRWVPAAKVRHMIPAERVSEDYFFAYQHASGETNAYLVHNASPALRGLLVSRPARVFMRSRLVLSLMISAARLAYWLLRTARGSSASVRPMLKHGYYSGAYDYLSAKSRAAGSREQIMADNAGRTPSR